MQSVLELPVPNDPLDKIWHFARDVAFGAIAGYWQPYIFLMIDAVSYVAYDQTQEAAIVKKWEAHPRMRHLLEVACTLGYFHNEADRYDLTEKALALLERPAELPSAFIAYGTEESSAFGLAVEYRLSAFGIPVFIDRSIPPGDDWDKHLETRIQKSRFVVCLLHPHTIARSDYVCKEIQLAHAFDCTFISIQHSGFDSTVHLTNPRVANMDVVRQMITERQSIMVRAETAKAYHDAVEELLNRLGVTLQRAFRPVDASA